MNTCNSDTNQCTFEGDGADTEYEMSPYTGQSYLFPVNGDVIDHEMETELFRAAEELLDSL